MLEFMPNSATKSNIKSLPGPRIIRRHKTLVLLIAPYGYVGLDLFDTF